MHPETEIGSALRSRLPMGIERPARIAADIKDLAIAPLENLIQRVVYQSPYCTGRWKSVHPSRGCWSASRVIITGGVTRGDDVIVAAGAVVSADVPSGVMVGGVPARVLSRSGS